MESSQKGLEPYSSSNLCMFLSHWPLIRLFLHVYIQFEAHLQTNQLDLLIVLLVLRLVRTSVPPVALLQLFHGRLEA